VAIKSKFNRGGAPSGGGSQHDSQQTLKLGFDDNLQSFRFHDSEAPIFDRFETTIDVFGNMTKIVYYVADTHEKTEVGVTADIGGNLNDKYFVLSSAYDRVSFYIWYNVDGAGVDPNIPNAIGIEVPISAGDTANIVSMATEMFVLNNKEFSYLFEVDRQNAVLTFKNKKEGPVTTNSTGTTSFVLNTVLEGTEIISEIYSFEYDSDCNITGMYKV
jgi:hypothetical protein